MSDTERPPLDREGVVRLLTGWQGWQPPERSELTGDNCLRVLDYVKRLEAERDRLTRWKAEASEVIEGWERVWEAAGQPGDLGQSKARAIEFEIERLRLIESAARDVDEAVADPVPDAVTGALVRLDVALRTKVRERAAHHHPPSSVSGQAVDVFTIDRAMTPRQIEDFKAAWDAVPRPSERVTQEATDDDRSE